MNHPGTGPASEIINRMSALRPLQIWCRGAGFASAAEHRHRRWKHSDRRMCFQLFPDIKTGQVEEEISHLYGVLKGDQL